MEIDRASQQPVAFEGVEFIRVGNTTKKLKEYPGKERTLWRVFDQVSFEDGVIVEQVNDEDVLLMLDGDYKNSRADIIRDAAGGIRYMRFGSRLRVKQ